MKRYKVVTTEGWQIRPHPTSTSYPPGMSASILDTQIIHREVKRFRSEDRIPGVRNKTRGHEGAKRAAQEYADLLNAECA